MYEAGDGARMSRRREAWLEQIVGPVDRVVLDNWRPLGPIWAWTFERRGDAGRYYTLLFDFDKRVFSALHKPRVDRPGTTLPHLPAAVPLLRSRLAPEDITELMAALIEYGTGP